MTEKDWNVIAIVRAGSDAEAEERLKQKCAYYFDRIGSGYIGNASMLMPAILPGPVWTRCSGV